MRRLRALPEGPVEWTCKVLSEAALVVMLVLIAVDIVTRWVFNFSFEVSDEVGGYMLVVDHLPQPLRLPRQRQLP